MKRTIITSLVLIFLIFVGFVGNAVAQVPPVACPKPTDHAPKKTLRIYNNNPTNGNNIYVFFESFIQDPNKADLWMQACFRVTDWDSNFVSPRRFVTTRLRRAYIQIGNDEGIAPGQSVKISIPFYTQLLTTTADNLGKVPDQYIDWWNSGRIVFFDSPAAYHSVKVTNSPDKTVPGGGLHPLRSKFLVGLRYLLVPPPMARRAASGCSRMPSSRLTAFRSSFKNTLLPLPRARPSTKPCPRRPERKLT